MISSDSLFLSLPLRLQRLVDEAFNLTVLTIDLNHAVYDKTTNNTIPQQNLTIGAGGFFPESYQSPSSTSTPDKDNLDRQNNEGRSGISLSLIPSALQLLDLPPDDSEVLSVFRNAASGWTSCSITSFENLDPQEKFVSKEDWRSVCAVLLEHRNSEISNNEHLPKMSQDGELDSADYIDSESGADPESSSDEYVEHHINIRPRKRVQDQHRQSRLARPPLPLDMARPSSRQMETCLKTFALFFPEVPRHKLADHRIMIKDVQRIAKLLGEKIKAEEMVEMLSTFSTSPDKSVGFGDFSRIMVIAELA